MQIQLLQNMTKNSYLSNFTDVHLAINKTIASIENFKDYVTLMNNIAVDFYSKNDYDIAFYFYTKHSKQ